MLGGGEPEDAGSAGGGALVVGDALEPGAAEGVCGGDEGEELRVEGAEGGGGLDEGFGEGLGGEPGGDGFGGGREAFGVGEVELGDAGELRRGCRWNQQRVAGGVEGDLEVGQDAAGGDLGENGLQL